MTSDGDKKKFIDVGSEVRQPQSWDDVPRFLAEYGDSRFEMDYALHDKSIAPNGLNLREMLECFNGSEGRAGLISRMYPIYVKGHGLGLEKAERYIKYSARGLLSPEMVTRAIDKAVLDAADPAYDRKFAAQASLESRWEELEAFAVRRSTLKHLRLGVNEVDAVLGGGSGIGPGEVLHLVGGEGGQKTSVALHALERYADNGGKALFISLDMHPREIEVRLLMRLLNCSRNRVYQHVLQRSAEYLSALESRREIDENLKIIGGRLTLTDISKAILTSNADVVGVDYVSLVSGFKNPLETAMAVSDKVRQLRDRWGITFVLLSQMSRSSAQDRAKGGTVGHALGGSSLEQLVDYEIELSTDEPLVPGDHRRLIAHIRKNRNGPSDRYFELFPLFPSIDISDKALQVKREKERKSAFVPWESA
jgi:KaiC/GvpD/RAD55 family RecA-like ATPase